MHPKPIRLKVFILAEKHCCPGETGSSVQLPAHLLENRAAKLSPNILVDMKLDFSQAYSNQNCFESLKIHLVPGLPALIVQRPRVGFPVTANRAWQPRLTVVSFYLLPSSTSLTFYLFIFLGSQPHSGKKVHFLVVRTL